jgi:hypothetical protein
MTGLLATAVGCGSDDSSGIDDGGRDFSELEKPYENAAECVQHLDDIGDINDGISCMCESCLEVMQECDALEGCVEIRRCGYETGCRGAFECYLVPPSPCAEVIDRWGNATIAAERSLAVSDCEVANGCLVDEE